MCRIFKFCHSPKLLSGNNAVYIVSDKIIYLIVCHSADNDVIIMSLSVPAIDGTIETGTEVFCIPRYTVIFSINLTYVISLKKLYHNAFFRMVKLARRFPVR